MKHRRQGGVSCSRLKPSVIATAWSRSCGLSASNAAGPARCSAAATWAMAAAGGCRGEIDEIAQRRADELDQQRPGA